MSSVLKFCADEGASLNSISLGQGQGVKAEALIDRGIKDGSWVFLMNCHLATYWMPMLEKICEGFEGRKDDIHDSFRLWCTTYPSNDFPVSVLQNAIKMSFEPPSGMRANLLGSYTSDPISDPSFFESVKKGFEFRRMCFALCFFHALIQERREFGSLGWNNPYEFNESDLRISVQQLAMFLDLYEATPYAALNYCFAQCNYGGRVTDDKDRRCLVTILKRFFNPSILEEGKELLPGSDVWVCPPDGGHESYIEFIDKLPLVADPALFMNQNANMTKDQTASTNLFNALLLTQQGVAERI